ncbi:hypothetical protein ACLMAL_26415 [Nocardia sp. CWNU-33]|uniref:hypothetical protein n=1 Tax=Nocardia sp. CWNU-33 TaxID=3392117 RepID=UPI00398F42DC
MEEGTEEPPSNRGSAKHWCTVIVAVLDLSTVVLQIAGQSDTSPVAMATGLVSVYLHVITGLDG